MAYVCECISLKERKVLRAIRKGAVTIDDVKDACGATANCGICEPAIQAILDKTATKKSDDSSNG